MLEWVMMVALGMMALAMLIALLRLALGPALQDRVVSLELIATLTVGMIVTAAAGTGQRALLDAAIVIALVGFLGTVAYAWYVEKEARS
jgi:multicomponent Na+:H+ antiporter subunit F